MKFRNYFFGMLTCAAFTACSSDNAPEIMVNDKGEGELSYLAVSIKNANGPATRTFEDGLEDESKVTNIRLYLFNQDGSAYILANSASGAAPGNNYVDITESTITGSTTPVDPKDDNITNKTQVISFKGTHDTKPAQLVAILNKPNKFDEGKKTLNDLKGLAADYSTGFTMSNSVYKQNQKEITATAVSPENIQPSGELAKNHPVKVYVERVVAKATVNKNTGTFIVNGTQQAIGEQTEAFVPTDKTEIKAVVKGWALTSISDRSNLLKNIEKADPGFDWNDETNFRSYWANMPNDVQYQDTNTWKKMTEAPQLYCQENTDATNPTKVLVKAQLQKNGQPVCIFRFMGTYYTGKDNDAPKTAIANAINGKYFIKDTGSENTYHNIKPEELVLKTKAQMTDQSGTDFNKLKSYHVAAQLADNVTEIYEKNTNGDMTLVSEGTKTVNTLLLQYPAEVAKDGMVYYYTNIEHAKTADNKPISGVVRNHVYKIKINSIKGFGTPVYNENQIIIPESPTATDSYIAAEINVLSWKVVSQDVNFGQ